jgi:hypothetical protein
MRFFGKGSFKRKKAGTMNGLERDYATRLMKLEHQGEIEKYWFESFKIRLADKTWFTPDFLVLTKEGFLEFHETKGFMLDDANVKLKVAAESWPFKFILVKKLKGNWEFKEI